MIRLVTDINIEAAIADAFQGDGGEIDVVSGQEAGLDGQPDEAILEWAALNDRILLTHDRNTMRTFAEDRLAESLPMSGIFLVRPGFTIGEVIEALRLIGACSDHSEWNGLIQFIPL